MSHGETAQDRAGEPPPLKITGIEFAYGQRVVLQGISLEAELGEIVGLVGPNGSGKTTLLRIVTGSLAPHQGEIYIQGRKLPSLQPPLSRTGQDWWRWCNRIPPFLRGSRPWRWSCWEGTPHLGLLQWEGRKDVELCQRAMELTETWEFAHRLVSSLSGGELQRVFIARALAQETPVLILDEPTAHLDISFQTGIFDTVERVRRSTKVTVLVAMHDLTLAAQYCDRIAALHQGSILAIGEPREVLTAELISRVFGTPVSVVEHPVHGTPVVLPVGQAVNVTKRKPR